jgi:hypothetical protein
VVDAGNLAWKNPVILPSERREREIKARLIFEAVALGGIDAMLPGEGDFAFGREFLADAATKNALPYVVSNLECAAPLPWPKVRVIERAGLKVAVHGVVAPDLQVEGCRPSDPAAVVGTTPADLVVVLSGQRRQDDEALSSRVKGIDLLVNGRDRDLLRSPVMLPGGGLYLAAGSRGKQIGALRVTKVAGATGWRDEGTSGRAAEERDRYGKRLSDLRDRRTRAKDDKERARLDKQIEFVTGKELAAAAELSRASADGVLRNLATNELHELGAEVPDHPATAALVAKALTEIGAGAVLTDATYNGPYVGSEVCGACHPSEAAQWKTTAHAHAWSTLVGEHRQHEADCWTCHSTGAHDPRGPKNSAAAIQDVGCESCHGPGRAHVGNPTGVDMVREVPTSTCTTCHDAKNDMGRFVEATYRPRVEHGPR